MNRIYIETNKTATSEYVFIQSLLKNLFGEEWKNAAEIIPVNGKDNLEHVVPQMQETMEQDGKNLVIFDADFPENNGGFTSRQAELLGKLQELDVSFELFLYPNNQDDGDVESCFEMMMLPEHQTIMECFRDFEMCLGSDYVHPNRKGRCFTYISSMQMSQTKRNKLGSGQWMFDNMDYWNINAEGLQPLKDFLRQHLLPKTVS